MSGSLSSQCIQRKKQRVLFSWSSGKDSAWALYKLQQDPNVEVVGLFTSINEKFERVAMHAVRVALLKQQADALGLPLQIIPLPYPCSNVIYEHRFHVFLDAVEASGQVDALAFGDIYLEDVRQYREKQLAYSALDVLFPLWGRDTSELSREMIAGGVKAVITCLNPKCLDAALIGHPYDSELLSKLDDGADSCAENGEFHTFVFDGPMFKSPLMIETGEIVKRDGFVFIDLLTASHNSQVSYAGCLG